MVSKPRVFRPAHLSSRQEASRQYEQRRGSARVRGYTAQWDRAAHSFKCDHPLCLGCEAVGVLTPTDVVDHVEPHKGDVTLFWDVDNWQVGCAWHHDVVKKRLEAMWMRGEIETDQLRLDSAAAKRLTLLLMPR